jgi:hypothetical protein
MICFSHNGINLDTREILSEQLCTRYPDSTMTFADRCEYTYPTSVDELPEENNISAFPNPALQSIKFTGLDPGDRITIYSILGNVVYEGTSQSAEFVIEPLEFGSGIYLYTIISLENHIVNGIIAKY